MFLHSCKTTAIEDVESGALAEFGGFQKKVERGDWLTLKSGWVDRPAPKEEGQRKSDGHGIGAVPSVPFPVSSVGSLIANPALT